jgi:uncharacterized protein involved in type VI secretion and phage assembly
MTTPDIVKKVLTDAGMAAADFRFDLVETYAPRNYCVQYQEDDLTFISRLLEEDGIYYFFEHTKDDHVLVISDHDGGHPPIPGDAAVWFVPAHGGGVDDRESVQSFRFGEQHPARRGHPPRLQPAQAGRGDGGPQGRRRATPTSRSTHIPATTRTPPAAARTRA